MKNRTRENCTSGSVRDEDGNILIYSANDRGDRGNVGIIRSPVRASILPDLAVWKHRAIENEENDFPRTDKNRPRSATCVSLTATRRNIYSIESSE